MASTRRISRTVRSDGPAGMSRRGVFVLHVDGCVARA